MSAAPTVEVAGAPVQVEVATFWEDIITMGLEAAVAALQVKTKYILAIANRVHMRADDDFVTGIPALASGATLLQACQQANALRDSQISHDLDVGSITSDGSHQVSDATSVTALQAMGTLGSASTLADLSTFIAALDTVRYNHASAMNGGVHVHFHDDVDENNANLTYGVPALPATLTLPEAITDLNDLRQFFVDHFARASE